MEKFSFNDLVLKFDVVINTYLSQHQEIHTFLEILREASLDEKYEFVFPLFYNFKIAGDGIRFLHNTGESYEWLIRDSVKSKVERHSSYGVGITESYCKSDIGPSYLEIKKSKEADNVLKVKIVRYEDCKFVNATLRVLGNESDLKVDSVNKTTETKVEFSCDWNVVFEDLKNNNQIKGINENEDFIKGIKAHYPIIEDGERILYYFFSNNLKAKEKDEKQYGFGGLFVISKGELDSSELAFFILSGYTLANKVALSQIQQSAKIETIKSAVAAIMSRNMSHNLGSHYLYYTKNNLTAIADKLDNSMAPDIRGAAKVLGYMQARMDYLATIVSGDKYPYASVYFKGQMFDELTIDDFSRRHFEQGEDKLTGKERGYKRTTNYLLQNLILSENYSTESVISDIYNFKLKDGEENSKEIGVKRVMPRYWTDLMNSIMSTLSKIFSTKSVKSDLIDNSEKITDDKCKRKTIRLQVEYKEGDKIDIFTGKDGETKKKENGVKGVLSKLCIALPGGIMSIHAFYNVVENLIRNSAKYYKEDLKGEELVYTIRIEELDSDKDKQLPVRYKFTIYDNKQNANKKKDDNSLPLIEKMNRELSKLRILTDNNELDKASKGLKEMLFSVLWMRSYTYFNEYGPNMTLCDILANWELLAPEDREVELDKHAFKYVNVDSNLGISFEIPKFVRVKFIGATDTEEKLISKGLDNFRDIVWVATDQKLFKSSIDEKREYDIKKVFTRVYGDGVGEEVYNSDSVNNDEYVGGKKVVEIFKSVLNKRFGNIDDFKINIEKKEKGYGKLSQDDKKEFGILFETHLGQDNQKNHLMMMKNHLYSEAVSGENFTKTIHDLLKKGMNDNGVIYEDSLYFALKVKEAALTRITLIDERFYNNMIENSTSPIDENATSRDFVFKCKNIRILNLKESDKDTAGEIDSRDWVKKHFVGNDFKDGKNQTHFLSIHLGMIEKIIKEKESCKSLGIEGDNTEKRAINLMKKLREEFKTDKDEVFISVHSGRGNFSKELEDALKEYPFISVSAIDAVLYNCKFLLAQLFYNTVYIGKGVTNAK